MNAKRRTSLTSRGVFQDQDQDQNQNQNQDPGSRH